MPSEEFHDYHCHIIEVTDASRIDLLDEAPPLNAEDSRFSISLAN